MPKHIAKIRAPKPSFNPHREGTELARVYETGWRNGYLQTEELLDHVTEVIAGAWLHHELQASPRSRRRAVIDIDALLEGPVRRDRDRESRSA
jgi:hypothetical protein